MEETSMSEMMLTLTEWKGFGVMQKLGCATAEGFPSSTFICILRKLNLDSTAETGMSLKCWQKCLQNLGPTK